MLRTTTSPNELLTEEFPPAWVSETLALPPEIVAAPPICAATISPNRFLSSSVPFTLLTLTAPLLLVMLQLPEALVSSILPKALTSLAPPASRTSSAPFEFSSCDHPRTPETSALPNAFRIHSGASAGMAMS